VVINANCTPRPGKRRGVSYQEEHMIVEAYEAVVTIHERIARDKRDEARRRWVVAELNSSELVRADADELLAFIEQSQ
jgi:sulfite reductase beta subunit-like hemoprotein